MKHALEDWREPQKGKKERFYYYNYHYFFECTVKHALTAKMSNYGSCCTL